MTTRIPRRRVAHPHKGEPYHHVNSQRGVDRAARQGYKWIDLDCHTDRDGVLWITHWPRPLAHGFTDPRGWTPRTQPIWLMPSRVVHRLVANPGRYRINKAKQLIRRALRRGLNVELELKSRWITKEQLADLRTYLQVAGLDPDRVQVKVGVWIPGHLPLLRRAHEAGFTTIILIHRGDTRLVPATAQAYIDHYRGRRPNWTGDTR